jgi:hypothetical protein
MRKPLETRLLTFDFQNELECGGEKAQFTTKLHFFALYQQKQHMQTSLYKIFTMKSKT